MAARVVLKMLILVSACVGLARTPVLSVAAPADPDIRELWVDPDDLATRDFFNGPWGGGHAPAPDDVYQFVEHKKGGINPGMTVRDSHGREWKVKQPPSTGRNAEGPIEVVLSRVLSGVGYHQPPVYYLPSFMLDNGAGARAHRQPGGRFRLSLAELKNRGEWKWMDNPFINTRPYYGLLVILLMFNSSDLKDSNNTLYEYRAASGEPCRWFVVRDIGTALGSTARLTPVRGDPDVFERLGFIKRIENGFVEFHYNGRHQPLVDDRIRPVDVRWAAQLLARVSDAQWHDAFRAGGYQPGVRQRFINRLKSKINDGLALP